MKKMNTTGVAPEQKKNYPSFNEMDKGKDHDNFLMGVETYKKLGFKFIQCEGKGLPEYPQVLFTLTGDWTGWNDILGTDPHSEHYSANILQDKEDINLLEDIWSKMNEINMEIPEIHFQRIREKVSRGWA